MVKEKTTDPKTKINPVQPFTPTNLLEIQRLNTRQKISVIRQEPGSKECCQELLKTIAGTASEKD